MTSKIAIITGATSGIGRATALRLASIGYNLVITGRRRERLDELTVRIREQYPISVEQLCFDVRDTQECRQAVDSLKERGIIPTILVNNAGLAAGLEHIYQGDFEDWNRMIDTNIKGVLNMTRLVSPMMIEQGRGHIINIGSIAGVQVYENGAVYCASKHALHALSQGMRIDLLSHGVKVSEIRPGMVTTEFSNIRFHGDDQRAQSVYSGVTPLTGEDIASVVEWILTLPAHVNINDIEVMPTAQANAIYTHRKA